MLYTVKEVSQKTGLSPYTIRYYLREGLFPSIERDSNGTRLFSKTNIESLYIIECMKRYGMTIREILLLMPNSLMLVLQVPCFCAKYHQIPDAHALPQQHLLVLR